MKKVIIILIIALVAIVAWQYVNKNSRRSRAGGMPVNIFMNQNQYTIAPNSSVPINVFFQTSPGQSMSAASIVLNYDPNVLMYLPAPAGQVDPSCTNWKFNTDIAVNDDQTNGILTISRAVLDTTANLPSGVFCFGTFPFVVKPNVDLSNGPVQTSIAFGPGESYDPNPWMMVGPSGGFSGSFDPNGQIANVIITNSPTTSTPAPTNMTVNLTLTLQGVTASSTVKQGATIPVRVSIAGGSLPSPVGVVTNFSYSGNGKWAGSATFSGVLPGSGYKILTKGPKHLQKKICDAAPNENSTGPLTYHCDQGTITLVSGTNTFDFSGVQQPVGDLPQQDGVLDAYDITYIRNNLSSIDPTVLSIGDVNFDGVVSTQDYSLILESLEVRPDEL